MRTVGLSAVLREISVKVIAIGIKSPFYLGFGNHVIISPGIIYAVSLSGNAAGLLIPAAEDAGSSKRPSSWSTKADHPRLS
jgi:hypothetical protein